MTTRRPLEHLLETDMDCWCNPFRKKLCPMCGGDDGGCYACDDGLIEADHDDEEDQIIIHQEES